MLEDLRRLGRPGDGGGGAAERRSELAREAAELLSIADASEGRPLYRLGVLASRQVPACSGATTGGVAEGRGHRAGSCPSGGARALRAGPAGSEESPGGNARQRARDRLARSPSSAGRSTPRPRSATASGASSRWCTNPGRWPSLGGSSVSGRGHDRLHQADVADLHELIGGFRTARYRRTVVVVGQSVKCSQSSLGLSQCRHHDLRFAPPGGPLLHARPERYRHWPSSVRMQPPLLPGRRGHRRRRHQGLSGLSRVSARAKASRWSPRAAKYASSAASTSASAPASSLRPDPVSASCRARLSAGSECLSTSSRAASLRITWLVIMGSIPACAASSLWLGCPAA